MPLGYREQQCVVGAHRVCRRGCECENTGSGDGTCTGSCAFHPVSRILGDTCSGRERAFECRPGCRCDTSISNGAICVHHISSDTRPTCTTDPMPAAHYTLYDDLFDDNYAPISEWNDHYDYPMRLDSQSNNIEDVHREMVLGAIGLLVITCCLLACCIIVWSAFLCVFNKSNAKKQRSTSISSYDVIASDHDEI
eukprot:42240_1